MDIRNLCINCFKPTGGEEVCMHCGTVQHTRPRQICHLFPYTILRERYIIGNVINNGGFGVVYKAYDTKLENIVAIKEFLPTQNSMVNRIPGSTEVLLINEEQQEEFTAMKNEFIGEARTMAQFANCESIVRIYEFFEENNTAYLVMEYLDGISLREFLSNNEGGMDFDSAMSIALPVMEALQAVHKENIIHCDVCPENIFICVNQHVKLIDFGAAKFSQDNRENDALITKPGFTPPEQYTNKGKLGVYTDVYAMGAVIYTILSGVTPAESIERLEKDNLQKLSKIGVQLPPYADKSIMKALALKEESRFKSIDDFIDAIQGKKKADFPEVELKKKKRRRTISLVFVFALMILSVVAAFIIKSSVGIIPTKNAEIELWYISSSDKKLNNRWKDIEKFFPEFVTKESGLFKPEITLKTKGFKSQEAYEKALEKAFKEGNAPDIYESGILSKDENAASLEKLYEELNEKDFGKAYRIMCDTYKEGNRIGLCYDMPVLYVSNVDSKHLPEKDESIDKLMEYREDDEREYEYGLVTNPEAVLYASYCYGYKNSKNTSIVNKLMGTAVNKDSSGKVLDNREIYMQREESNSKPDSNSKYYIGLVSDYSKINDMAYSADNFEILPLTGKKMLNFFIFPEVFSVNAQSDQAEQQAAVFLLYYLINNVDGAKTISRTGTNYHYVPMSIACLRDFPSEAIKVIDNTREYYSASAEKLAEIEADSQALADLAESGNSKKAKVDKILK